MLWTVLSGRRRTPPLPPRLLVDGLSPINFSDSGVGRGVGFAADPIVRFGVTVAPGGAASNTIHLFDHAGGYLGTGARAADELWFASNGDGSGRFGNFKTQVSRGGQQFSSGGTIRVYDAGTSALVASLDALLPPAEYCAAAAISQDRQRMLVLSAPTAALGATKWYLIKAIAGGGEVVTSGTVSPAVASDDIGFANSILNDGTVCCMENNYAVVWSANNYQLRAWGIDNSGKFAAITPWLAFTPGDAGNFGTSIVAQNGFAAVATGTRIVIASRNPS
jgi:hypothetical protein